jgi:hypothetical protein
LCIAENADFGILRGIVSDPDKAYKALKDNHFAVNVTDVVGISCPNIPGALAKVLGYLSDEGVFIEYMYSFANNNIANVVIRPSNLDKCIEVLKEKKVDLLAASAVDIAVNDKQGTVNSCVVFEWDNTFVCRFLL